MSLGIGLLVSGLLLAVLVWGVLKLLPSVSAMASRAESAIPTGPDQSEEAVVLIEPGGRVEYLNARAREWFALEQNARIDLEQLLRGVMPADDFLALCAAPGKKRLNVNGRPVEVTSHQIPGTQAQMLISMSTVEFPQSIPAEGGGLPASILEIITDFTNSITSSLDLETVLRSIAEGMLRLVATDILEMKVLDRASRGLVAYRFEQRSERGPRLVRAAQSQFGSLAAAVVETRKPLFLRDAAALADAQPGGSASAVTSYVALPLIAGEEVVGVVEGGQITRGPFTSQEFDLLRLLATQSGVALRNAMLYQKERLRALELSVLANVAQAVTSMGDPRELFGRLVESIVPLFDVQILGFLLYDGSQRILAGEVPFHGLVQNVVEVYRAEIPAGGPGDVLLRERRPILSMNAAADDRWQLLGLTDVAVAASLQDTALVPLISSGRMLGYLQASNHQGGTREFSESEVRLLQIVGNQAAAIIENTRLLWQRSEQLRRSEAARTITDITASSATVDEALLRVLEELAGLFGAQFAVALLLEETRGLLQVHRDSARGPDRQRVSSIPSLAVDQPEYSQTVTAGRRPLLSGRLTLDAQLLPFYHRVLDGLGLESVVVVPIAAHGKSLGELILGSRRAELFNQADVGLLSTAGAQLASTIEGLRLATQTDASLRRRVEQLSSMARLSREMAGSLSVEHLLAVIHDELIGLAGADCGSVLLVEAPGAPSGQHRRRSIGCLSGEELSRMEQRSLETRQSLSIDDFGRAEFPPPHSGVKSALVVPVVDAGRTVGLIQLHSSKVVGFDAGAQEMVQTLAAQAAVALMNAGGVEEERREAELLRRRAETLERFSNASYVLNPEQPLEASLSRVAESIRDSTPFRTVLISLFEPETGMIRRVAGAGIEPETLAELQARRQPLSALRQLLKPQFKISHSYYIPADQTPVLPPDIHYVYAGHYSVAEAKQNAWDPDDFLLLPLEDAPGDILGLISLDDPANGLRPDRATIESVELFAAQATQVINDSRRMQALNSQVESMSAALDRQQQLLNVTQNDLPVLLHKDLEQTIAMHSLDRRTQRIRAGLKIIESVSRQLDASSALLALARETLTQLGMTAAVIAENTEQGPRLVRTVGAAPAATNAEALFGQRNPLRAVLQTGVPILIADLEENDEWRHTPLLSQLRARGVVCLPLLAEDRAVAAMLAVSTAPLPAFTDEDRQVYQQISRQASVILQNISLLAETRRRLQEVNILLDFSRRLTGLDSSQILSALLESARHAVKAAHAGVVLMWNEEQASLVPREAAGYADDEAMRRISYRQGEALPGKVFASGKPQRADQIDFRRDYLLKGEAPGLYRQATGGRLPVSSLLLPILVEGRAVGLMVLDNFNTPAAFSGQDEALAISLAQQAALSLENVRLFAETQQLAQQMEQRVIERTAELSREQQHTEALLRKEKEEASRSQAILESVADAVVVTGPDNRITFLNSSVERILAAEADGLLGQTVEAFGGLFGEAGSAWLEAVRRWSSATGALETGDTYADRLELSNNRIALIHLAPVILGEDFLGTVSILRDITHEVEVDRLKSEFVATVSHELRTPITSIKGYVEMLLMGAAGTIDENQSHFLDVIRRNIDRLNTLVDGLLEISRIEAGKVSLTQESLDLTQVAREAIAEMERTSAEDKKPMSLSLQVEENLPRIRGDAQRVRQIVLGVLSNAYHYTPANGSVKVALHSLEDGHEVQLDIVDNGVGIRESDQARIFERFFRGEDPLVLATPGTGLGLAIAKQLVEMHRGRIWFRSDGVPGQGSTFSIAFPAYQEPSPGPSPESPNVAPARAASTPPR